MVSMDQGPALLLRDFANTVDHESGTDELTSPEALHRWLDEHALLPAEGLPVTEADVANAVALREGLRAEMVGNHGPRITDESELERLLAPFTLRLVFADAGPVLVPAAGGAAGALAWLAAAVISADAAGTWTRLKICPEDTCRWAFLDTSKNRSRTWCSMQTCGNRTKTRAYRERKSIGKPE